MWLGLEYMSDVSMPDPDAFSNTFRNTKHELLADRLRVKVRAGDYGDRLPRMVDLAEAWGVAPVTMSKAVETLKEEGVLRVVRGQGIFPTRLRRQRTHVLGGVMRDSGGGHLHAQLIHGLGRAAAAMGEGFTLGEETRGDPEVELRETQRLCEKQGVDGLVLWNAQYVNDRRSPTVAYLQEERIPFVLVPEPDLNLYADCHTVSNVDSGAAAYVMTHLLAAGHRNIRFVRTPREAEGLPFHHRLAQYRQTMQAAGNVPLPPIVVPERAGDLSGSVPQDLEDALRGATAVFCATDHAAFSLMRICLRLGIRIPTDLSVCGYDNVSMSEVMGLTTVEQHFPRIAQQAVALLLDEIEGRTDGPVHRQVHSELILRSSTGAVLMSKD